MSISWLTFREGKSALCCALVFCGAFPFLLSWLGSEDMGFNVVTAVVWSIVVTCWHCRGHYITVAPSGHLCIRSAFRTVQRPCASVARVESIRGFTYRLVLTTGEEFLFVDHPSRSRFGKQPERARELAAMIKSTCAEHN
jgi:hypothetical protein